MQKQWIRDRREIFLKLLHGSIDMHGFSTRKLLTFTFALSHLLNI